MINVTPVEKHGNLWFKRDDLFELGGMYGAKVRACLALCMKAKAKGHITVVSSGSRFSPQLAILGTVAKYLGLNAEGFTASGGLTPLISKALSLGVFVSFVPYGRTSVIQKAARDFVDIYKSERFLVPFGMKDDLSVEITKQSFLDSFFPDWFPVNNVKRIVITAGSGVNLAGILKAMEFWHVKIPVLAVMVGHDCRKYVYNQCPWVTPEQLSFVKSSQGYHELSTYSRVNDVDVDARYEGKAIPFLVPGDLFWLIGKAISPIVAVPRNI